MINEMPLKIIKKHFNGRSINLDTFFGFVKVLVRSPKDVKRPMLPTKFKCKSIYPTGEWIGSYLS